MIRNNLFYKLLALVIAIGLWAYVNAERNPQAQKVLTVPLEIRNLARGYAAEVDTRDVSITIQGPKSSVDSVRREDAAAWLDLQGLKAGPSVIEGRVNVGARVSAMAENEMAVTISPRSVKVRAEAIKTKRLPVEVKFLAPPPLGYSYTEPIVEPDTVGISGKFTQIVRVKRVLLGVTSQSPGHPIDGQFAITSTDAVGAPVTGVTLDTDKVHLKLGLVEAPATKAVVVSENVTGRPKLPAKILKVAVSPQSVTLEGRPQALMEVSTVETDEVSVEGVRDTVTREVALKVPAGVRVVGARKVRVTVQIGEKE